MLRLHLVISVPRTRDTSPRWDSCFLARKREPRRPCLPRVSQQQSLSISRENRISAKYAIYRVSEMTIEREYNWKIIESFERNEFFIFTSRLQQWKQNRTQVNLRLVLIEEDSKFFLSTIFRTSQVPILDDMKHEDVFMMSFKLSFTCTFYNKPLLKL